MAAAGLGTVVAAARSSRSRMEVRFSAPLTIWAKCNICSTADSTCDPSCDDSRVRPVRPNHALSLQSARLNFLADQERHYVLFLALVWNFTNQPIGAGGRPRRTGRESSRLYRWDSPV